MFNLTSMALGKNIRRRREQLGWTLDQLSEASGVEIGTISALELRDSKRSQFATALAKALGVSVEGLETGAFSDAARDERHIREPETAPLYLSSNTQLESVSAVSKTSSDRWPLPDADYRRFTALPPEGRAWALAKFEGGISEAETRYMNHANIA